MGILRWSEVEGVAKEAFSIWVDQPELKWTKELGISPIRVGLRLDSDDWLNWYENDEALYEDGIKSFADEARVEVFKALFKKFRDKAVDSSEGTEADLFLLLWKSPWSDEARDRCETDSEILNNVTSATGAAYEWISSGCEPLH